MTRYPIVLVAGILFLMGNAAAQRRESSSARKSGGSESAVQNPTSSNSYEVGLNDLATKIITRFRGNQKKSLAVLDFRDVDGKQTKLGIFLAEELTTKLFESGKFEKIVERAQLQRIIENNKLDITDVMDASGASKLGKLAGVSNILIGSITNLGSVIKINGRIVDTQVGEIVSAASGEVVADQRIKALMTEVNPIGPSRGSAPQTSTETKRSGSGRTYRTEVGDLSFVVKQCVLRTSTATCKTTISNSSADIGFGIDSSYSYIVDNQGRQYGLTGGNAGSNTLVTNVATPVDLVFDRVDPRATLISLLNIRMTLRASPWNVNAKIKNIPLLDEEGNQLGGGSGAAAALSDNQASFQVPANQAWTESEIDVAPGMQVKIQATGTITLSNGPTAGNRILGSIINTGKNGGSPTGSAKTGGTDRLLLKIRYSDGSESRPIKVGSSYALSVTKPGRLIFGIDDTKFDDNSGSFDVTVTW
ncbi:MAG TPA: FlgO family outer membrane protein [Pyrinomonadaceae bacterium]|nr:FlgO family outer membrane protein [Pyrinomonadaceae bacterium]